jgi:hypothetical protein
VGGRNRETGNLAISVIECSLPSLKVSRIDVILLVTDRPDSEQLPAKRTPTSL